MTKGDISAHEILGLLDEIQFTERLFWRLPAGTLVTAGATTAALSTRLGYPGRHIALSLEELTSIGSSIQTLSRPMYYLGDLAQDGYNHGVPSLRLDDAPVIDVLEEVYPTWCSSQGRTHNTSVPPKTLAIIGPPRSGSTYLCSLLTNTQRFGSVAENLRHHTVALARTGAIDLADWWGRLARHGSVDGIFATKIVHDFLVNAWAHLEGGAYRRLVRQAGDWTIVTLTREDIVERAVSMYLAEQTGVWRIDDDTQYARFQKQVQNVPYDYRRLSTIWARMADYQRLADQFVRDAGGAALCLAYEEIAADGVGACLKVVDAVGGNRAEARRNLEKNRKVPRPSHTSANQLFVQRFRADMASERPSI